MKVIWYWAALVLGGILGNSWAGEQVIPDKCPEMANGSLIPSQPALLERQYSSDHSLTIFTLKSSQISGYTGKIATRLLISPVAAVNQNLACSQYSDQTGDGFCAVVAVNEGRVQLTWNRAQTGYAFVSQGFCLGTEYEYWTAWRGQENGVPLLLGAQSQQEPVRILTLENSVVILEYTALRRNNPKLIITPASGGTDAEFSVASTHASLQAAIADTKVDFSSEAENAPVVIAHFEEESSDSTRRIRTLMRMPAASEKEYANWNVKIESGGKVMETQFTVRAQTSYSLRGELFSSLNYYQGLAVNGVLFTENANPAGADYSPLWAMMLLRSGLGPDRFADIQARLAYHWKTGYDLSAKSGAARHKVMLDVLLQVAAEALPLQLKFLNDDNMNTAVEQSIKTFLNSPGRLYYDLLNPGRQLLIKALPLQEGTVLNNLQWEALNGVTVKAYDYSSATDKSAGMVFNSSGYQIQATQPGVYELQAQMLPRFFHTSQISFNDALGAQARTRIVFLQKAVIGTELASGKNYPAQFIFKPGMVKKFRLPDESRLFGADLEWSYSGAMREYPSENGKHSFYDPEEPGCSESFLGSIVREDKKAYFQVSALKITDRNKICRAFLELRNAKGNVESSMSFDMVASNLVLEKDVVYNKGKCVDAKNPDQNCSGNLDVNAVLLHPALLNSGRVEMELTKNVIQVFDSKKQNLFSAENGKEIRALPRNNDLRKTYFCSDGGCGSLQNDLNDASFSVVNTGGGSLVFRYYTEGERKQSVIDERIYVNGYWLDWAMHMLGSWDSKFEGVAPGYIFQGNSVDLILKVKPDNLNEKDVSVIMDYPAAFADRFLLTQVNGEQQKSINSTTALDLSENFRKDEDFTIRYTLKNSEEAPFSVPLIAKMRDKPTGNLIIADTLYVTNAKCPEPGPVVIHGINLQMSWNSVAWAPDYLGLCIGSGIATLTEDEIKKHLPTLTVDLLPADDRMIQIPVQVHYDAIARQWVAIKGEWKSNDNGVNKPRFSKLLSVGDLVGMSLHSARIEITTERNLFLLQSELKDLGEVKKKAVQGDNFLTELKLTELKGYLQYDLLNKTVAIKELGNPKLQGTFKYRDIPLIQLVNHRNSVQPSADLNSVGVLSGSYVSEDPQFTIGGQLGGTDIEISPIGFSWDLLKGNYQMVNRGFVKLSRKLDETWAMDKISLIKSGNVVKDVELMPGTDECAIDFYLESNGMDLTARLAMDDCMYKPGLFIKNAALKMSLADFSDLIKHGSNTSYSLSGGLFFFSNLPDSIKTKKSSYKYSALGLSSFLYVDKVVFAMKGGTIESFSISNATGSVNLSAKMGSLDAYLKKLIYQQKNESWTLKVDSLGMTYSPPAGKLLQNIGFNSLQIGLNDLDMENGKFIRADGSLGVFAGSSAQPRTRLNVEYERDISIENRWGLSSSLQSKTAMKNGFEANGLFRQLLPVDLELAVFLGSTGNLSEIDAFGVNAAVVVSKGSVPVPSTPLFITGGGFGFCHNCFEDKGKYKLDPTVSQGSLNLSLLIGGPKQAVAAGLTLGGTLSLSNGGLVASQDCKGNVRQISLNAELNMPAAEQLTFFHAKGDIGGEVGGDKTALCVAGQVDAKISAPEGLQTKAETDFKKMGYSVKLWDVSGSAKIALAAGSSAEYPTYANVTLNPGKDTDYGTFISIYKKDGNGNTTQSFITTLSSNGKPEFKLNMSNQKANLLIGGDIHLSSTGHVRIGNIPADLGAVTCANLKRKSVRSGLYGMLDFSASRKANAKVDADLFMQEASQLVLNDISVKDKMNASMTALGALYVNALGWDGCKEQKFEGSVDAEMDVKLKTAESKLTGELMVSGNVSIKAEGFLNTEVNREFELGTDL